MTERRFLIRDKLIAERDRQFDLPGSECDIEKGTDNWCATILRYVGEIASRGGRPPHASDFEDALIKAGAVIIAALEHVDTMKEHNKFTPEDDSVSYE